MQIEENQSVCPACGAEGLEISTVLHHMMCAYVGPQYDFVPAVDGYICPKCRRDIVSGDLAYEIVGTSARCGRCGKEMVVSPPLRQPPG
jgi:transcription elongation factor Elf1